MKETERNKQRHENLRKVSLQFIFDANALEGTIFSNHHEISRVVCGILARVYLFQIDFLIIFPPYRKERPLKLLLIKFYNPLVIRTFYNGSNNQNVNVLGFWANFSFSVN